MDWFESFKYCHLSSVKKEFNVQNDWLSGLYLQTPWMVYRGKLSFENHYFNSIVIDISYIDL